MGSKFVVKSFSKFFRHVIKSIKTFFARIGIGITASNRLTQLQQSAHDLVEHQESTRKLELLSAIGSDPMLKLVSKSKSQLGQDLFVISEYKYKKNGFFVEFGATNGIDLSNSYLLETEFAWTGILAEPAHYWQKDLAQNRQNAQIETLCVWKDSDSILTFNETMYPELSTINLYSDRDLHKKARLSGINYQVNTVSLCDLLKKFRAPRYIDYLSIDTEGSEFEILANFCFEQFSFGIITVEHNYTPNREKIFNLLSRHGYIRKLENISKFDDWYVKKM